MKTQLKQNLLIAIAGVAWIGSVATGVSLLTKYEFTASPQHNAPSHWPNFPQLDLGRNHTLVMAIHPKCPCTRATFDELELLVARRPDLKVHILFYQPDGQADSWTKTELWNRALAIPKVHAIIDEDGAVSSQFNQLTSGQAALYDGTGRLVFQGGITAARGQAGDNIGLATIEKLTSGTTIAHAHRHTPVFGCSLGRAFN